MDRRKVAVLQPREEAVFARGGRTDDRDLLSRPPIARALRQTNDLFSRTREGCEEQEDTKCGYADEHRL